MKRKDVNLDPVRKRFLVALSGFLLTASPASRAAFLDDVEKPTPEFAKEGNLVVGKLIPRGKSTGILIQFGATGGELLEVKGMAFKEAAHPLVDSKDFRSDLFVVSLRTASPGAEASFSLRSGFFTPSTELWIFNQRLDTPWMNAKVENIRHSDRTVEMVLRVKDGDQLDSDGEANGQVILIGGPKDSFWGYAIGTLFIRFFGVFVVLSILLLGLVASGKVFQRLEANTARKTKPPVRPMPKAEEHEVLEDQAGPEVAAAVALALSLHTASVAAAPPAQMPAQGLGAWAQQGRATLMGARSIVFNRGKW